MQCFKRPVPLDFAAYFTDLTLGNSATAQCVNLPSLNGISIKWINSKGHNISNDNILVLSNVTPLLQNTVYTCTAVVASNPMSCALPQNKTVTVTIKGAYYITFTNRLTTCYFRNICAVSKHSISEIIPNQFIIND